MKILYLAEWDAFSPSGVIKKIATQFATWRDLGCDARLVCVSPRPPSGEVSRLAMPGAQTVEYPNLPYGLGKLSKGAALHEVSRRSREWPPDLIYYRQSSWTPGILAVLRTAKRVAMEINSNDTLEIHSYGRIKAAYHLLTRKRLLDAVSGFVCVGSELGDFYSRYGKPVCVIGNGFDTSSVRPRPCPHNPRPQLVFVGSKGQPWHGVDKLVAAATALPEMDFHVVGETLPRSAANLVAHGYLDWPRLHELYSTMDVGLGTLALHRIDMNEITPLKTREYLAHGLPVIGAYDDIDLRESAFYLRLPNTESGVSDSIDAIRAFVLNWKDKPIDMNEVAQRIDSRRKEERRLVFFESLLRG